MKKWILMSVAARSVAGAAFAEEAVESVGTTNGAAVWLGEMFGGLAGMKWYTAAILAALALMGILLTKKQKKWNSREIAYASMCIAIAFVLSCIKLFRMPRGGSVTPAAMLPLILFTVVYGPAKGLVVGCAFGLLQLIEDPYVIHPIQLLVDYPMAYGAMAVSALALKLPGRAKLPAAMALGYLARLAMATLSGAVFFAEYAGEQNALVYSIVYNGSYLLPEALIAAAIALVPGFGRISRNLRSGERPCNSH